MSCQVELRSLERRFGGRTALKMLDHRFPPGSATLLLGPNGVGKSTLLALIAGLLRPTRGCVLLDGRDARLPEARRGVGVALGDPLPPRRTAAQLLAATGNPPRWEGLLSAALLHRPTNTLSAGQRARVALGLALAAGSRLLLLDEPLTALDEPNATAVIGAVRSASERGTTLILATHHPSRWASLAAEQLLLGET